MEARDRLKFRKGDVLALLLVALLALGTGAAYTCMGNREEAKRVQVWHEGQLVREISLQSEETFRVEGDYISTVTVSGGRAAITASDCPGADCVHSGWIALPGRSVVCLPNRVEIRITGEAEVDFVVG